MLSSERDNKLRQAGVAKLLEKIKVANDDVISCNGVAMYADELAQLALILKDKKFSVLNLNHNELASDGMKVLKQILLDNKNLVEVFLEYNHIDNDAISALLEGDEIKQRLRSVDLMLSCNPLREEAVEAAIPYFSMMSMLTMVSGSFIKNQQLIDSIKSIYRNYTAKEDNNIDSKEEPRRKAPLRFFDLLPADIQKNKTNIVDQLERKSPTRS